MGVAKYHTSADMPEELRKALPDIDSLKRLLSESNDIWKITDSLPRDKYVTKRLAYGQIYGDTADMLEEYKWQ